ncbi:signal recognition particle protein [bacterium]|nr:signal recognition particle protein [bacterium]MBT3903541.1 signal recognition particle protein [bacterium]MBT6131406.1 signal recognition particle protein [bacterium]MBT6528616.1 signal recognition particle protein [bacterium]
MFDFLSSKFGALLNKVTGQSVISKNTIKEALQEVRSALIEADVPFEVVEQFVGQVEEKAVGQQLKGSLKAGDQFVKIVHDEMVEFLGSAHKKDQDPLALTFPATVIVMGLQGSGKTTTLSKLAFYMQKQAKKRGKKRSIMLASVDFYRPAAIDQLEVLAKSVGVTFYRSPESDVVSAAKDCVDQARKQGIQVLLLDTAGRLHVDESMLEELKQVVDVVKPQKSLLVLDAMTGQESMRIAQAFDKAVGFDGAVLSKVDSDARGGVAFAFAYQVKKPVYFVGVGERPEDMDEFRPERIASRILGKGDVVSLVEKVEEKIKVDERKSMERAYRKGTITLEDFASQLGMMSRLGSMNSIMKHLPGMGQSITPEMMERAELESKKFKAILSSMTRKERLYHKILNTSRKRRIANGAGATKSDIDLLLRKFEESQRFVKLLKRMGGLGKFFG